MTSIVLWSLAGAVLLVAGWLAGSWHVGRKLAALQQHLKSVKQTHAEHAEQMKRQIGQLQADLEARKAAMPPQRRAPEAAPARPSPSTREERTAAVNAMLAAGGFAATQVVGAEGFAATEVMQ